MSQIVRHDKWQLFIFTGGFLSVVSKSDTNQRYKVLQETRAKTPETMVTVRSIESNIVIK